jgi:hypothetical protein
LVYCVKKNLATLSESFSDTWVILDGSPFAQGANGFFYIKEEKKETVFFSSTDRFQSVWQNIIWGEFNKARRRQLLQAAVFFDTVTLLFAVVQQRTISLYVAPKINWVASIKLHTKLVKDK